MIAPTLVVALVAVDAGAEAPIPRVASVDPHFCTSEANRCSEVHCRSVVHVTFWYSIFTEGDDHKKEVVVTDTGQLDEVPSEEHALR